MFCKLYAVLFYGESAHHASTIQARAVKPPSTGNAASTWGALLRRPSARRPTSMKLKPAPEILCSVCNDPKACSCESKAKVDSKTKVNVVKSRHENKNWAALQRHIQRNLEARKRFEDSSTGKQLPPSTLDWTPEEKLPEEPYGGEQLLFVHFIPPSLRQKGKEKVPWIVHCTGDKNGRGIACREAVHVVFRSVTNFETFEGTASGQVCNCAIAQHHLRGYGCFRMDERGYAIIESVEVAARVSVNTQTDSAVQHPVETQTECSESHEVETQADFPGELHASQTDPDHDRECEMLSADHKALVAELRKSQAYGRAADATLRIVERSHQTEKATMRARIAELEQLCVAKGRPHAPSSVQYGEGNCASLMNAATRRPLDGGQMHYPVDAVDEAAELLTLRSMLSHRRELPPAPPKPEQNKPVAMPRALVWGGSSVAVPVVWME